MSFYLALGLSVGMTLVFLGAKNDNVETAGWLFLTGSIVSVLSLWAATA